MTTHLLRTALATGLLLAAAPAFAAEGAATGNATSTDAGPAASGSGPSKPSESMSKGSGHMMKKTKHHKHSM